MRKHFLAMAAMATLLTSCSKDDTTTAPVNQRAKVTFAVSAPELQTRAGEGNVTTATQLEYVIYDLAEDEGSNQIAGTAEFDSNLQAIVKVDLVEGRTYDAIFFAKAPNSPYTFDHTAQTMTIDTEKLMANAEAYDAFYKYVEPFTIETTGNEMDVEMTRPFTQLNIATNDSNTEAGKMIDAKTTGVELQAYTTLNFKDGTVSDKKTINYGLANKMNGKITVDSNDYDWLTMNYILVNTQELVDVKFFFTDEPNNGAENPLTRAYGKVPVERNHRTNIYGSIITNPAVFNVEIKPEFLTPDHNVNGSEQYEVTVTNATELQAAINAAKEGRTIIKFADDIDATQNNINISQQEKVDLVIDGANYKFDGTFYVDGDGQQSNTEALTFLNINFETSSSDRYFIDANASYVGKNYNYAHNVTVDGCTFTGSANDTTVGLRIRQGKNLSVVNTTASGMHSLMQLYGTAGEVYIDGVTVTDSKNGVSLGTSTNVVIKNSNISTTAYGIRGDGEVAATLTIENTSIDAKQPIIIRKVTEDGYSVALEGKNTLTASDLYDVVFTNDSDDEPYVTPTGNWSITGAEGLNVYPTALTEGFNASSSTQLSQAIAAGATTVNLSEGEYSMPATGGKDVTIVGTKETVVNANTANLGSGNLTLEGVTIKAGSYNGFQHSGVVTYNKVTIEGQLNCYGSKDIFNGCTFNLDNTYVWTYGSDYTEFNNCIFNTNGKAILIYNEGAGACNVTVTGCTFNATAGAKAGAIANQNCAAIEIDNYAKMSHKLSTSNNTYSDYFSGEWRIKNYVEGAPVTVNGKEYTQLALDGKLMTIDGDKNVTVEE